MFECVHVRVECMCRVCFVRVRVYAYMYVLCMLGCGHQCVVIYGVCMCTGVCSCEFIDWFMCYSISDPLVRSELGYGRFRVVPVVEPIQW